MPIKTLNKQLKCRT